MLYWRVEPYMLRKGWTTAYQLAKESGISRPGALRVLNGAPVERVDVAMLAAMARTFGVRNPLALLEWRDE